MLCHLGYIFRCFQVIKNIIISFLFFAALAVPAFPMAEAEDSFRKAADSLTVARDRKAGSYHLMQGQNPIYIFTMQAGA